MIGFKRKNNRVIKIRHPFLMRLRLNLRLIIKEAYNDQIASLKAYWLGLEGDLQIIMLRKIERLRQSYNSSICICVHCNSLNEDMIYISKYNGWFCVKCYNKGLVI